MPISLGSISVTFTGIATQFNQAIRQINSGLTSVNTQANRTQRGLENLARELVGLAIARRVATGINSIITSFAELENQTRRVARVMGEDAQQNVGRLMQQFQTLSKEIPKTAIELAQTGEEIARLGVDDTAVLNVTKIVAVLSEVAKVDPTIVAERLASLSIVTQTSIKNIENLASAIITAADAAVGGEKNILDLSNRFGAAAHAAGFTVQGIIAIAGALSDAKISAELGGTAMQKFVQNLEQSVKEGGTNLELFANIAGMTGQQFKKVFEQDATEALFAFIQGLKNASESGEALAPIMRSVGIENERQILTLRGLTQNLDKARDSYQKVNQSFRENTRLQQAAIFLFQGLETQLKLLSNRFDNIVQNTGKELNPVMKTLINIITYIIDSIQNLITSFSELPQWIKDTIFVIAGLTVAFTALAGAIALVALALGTTLGTIVVGAIAGITTLVTGVIAGHEAFKGIKSAISSVTKELKDLNKEAKKPDFSEVIDKFLEKEEKIKKALTTPLIGPEILGVPEGGRLSSPGVLSPQGIAAKNALKKIQLETEQALNAIDTRMQIFGKTPGLVAEKIKVLENATEDLAKQMEETKTSLPKTQLEEYLKTIKDLEVQKAYVESTIAFNEGLTKVGLGMVMTTKESDHMNERLGVLQSRFDSLREVMAKAGQSTPTQELKDLSTQISNLKSSMIIVKEQEALNTALRTSKFMAENLGESFDKTGADIEAYNTFIQNLVTEFANLNNAPIDKIVLKLNAVQNALQKIQTLNTDKIFEDIIKQFTMFDIQAVAFPDSKETDLLQNKINSLKEGMNQFIKQLGESAAVDPGFIKLRDAAASLQTQLNAVSLTTQAQRDIWKEYSDGLQLINSDLLSTKYSVETYQKQLDLAVIAQEKLRNTGVSTLNTQYQELEQTITRLKEHITAIENIRDPFVLTEEEASLQRTLLRINEISQQFPQLRSAIQDIFQQFEDGDITLQQLDKSLQKIVLRSAKIPTVFEQLTYTIQYELVQFALNDMVNILDQAIRSGDSLADTFKQIAKAVVELIGKLALQLALTLAIKALGGALGGAGGAAGAGGGGAATAGGASSINSVLTFGDGGIVTGSALSWVGEKGPEAIIPLKNGNVPVEFTGSIESITKNAKGGIVNSPTLLENENVSAALTLAIKALGNIVGGTTSTTETNEAATTGRTNPISSTPTFGDGGVVTGPVHALIGERGPEAIIPLKNGNIPVAFTGMSDFSHFSPLNSMSPSYTNPSDQSGLMEVTIINVANEEKGRQLAKERNAILNIITQDLDSNGSTIKTIRRKLGR